MAQCIVPKTDKPLTFFRLTSTIKISDNVNILGMIATEDNNLLLCNYNERQQILVYNDSGQYVSSITMQHWPYDIAVLLGGDQYIVTLPEISSIQFINIKNLKPGRRVEIPAFYFTYGITADKQCIYVSDFNKILVLRHDGTIKWKIKPEFNVNYLHISDNNLYISDNDKIYCHSLDHNTTIHQTRISGVGRIRKIMEDLQGNIYVGGEKSGKVYRLSKDLQENMIIRDKLLTQITAICFNKQCTKLFVACNSGKTIAVFSCT